MLGALRCGLLTMLVIGSAACWGDDTPWQAHAAAEMRELEYWREVAVVSMTREEFAAQAEQQAQNIDEEYLQYYADTYGRLGYFDRGIDLRPVFAGSSSDWVGASYSLGTEVITLVGAARDDVIVHEFVHALQDQNFDLGAYDALETSDSFLARRAVVEGDAVLAQSRFIMVYERDSELDMVDWRSSLDWWRDYSLRTLAEAEYPLVFLDYPSFVYPYGFEYTTLNLVGVTYDDPEPARPAPHDWELENELFLARAPDTTQQILLRDIYLDAADPVVDIGLSAVPEELSGIVETVDWDRLGEWYVYLLLFPLFPADAPDARALAAAWDGDRVLFLRYADTDESAVLWASAWDDEEAAEGVADALWRLYGRTPLKGTPEYVALGDDGESVWVERRGNLLVAARNLDLSSAAPLVDAAFAGEAAATARRNPSLPAAIEKTRELGRHQATVMGHPESLL